MNLVKLREHCTELQIMCHKNINRILEMMVKHPDHGDHLNKYAKLCIVMEKLCEYISSSCCNQDKVSKHIICERKEKCIDLCAICDKLCEVLPKDVIKYIRCKETSKLSKSIRTKSKKHY